MIERDEQGMSAEEPVHEQAPVPALADREAVLADLTRHVTAAWASFDHPRAAEPRGIAAA